MRACILSVVEPKHMVMISMYTEFFDIHQIPYDIVYMDRYHVEEETNAENVYRCEINSTNSINKIIGYIKFKLYAQKVLKKIHYDFIAVWNEYTAVLFSNFLEREYKGRYSVNVRDLFDPDDRIRKPELLYPILNKAIQNSAFTTVSSGKYISYLTKFDKYIFVHSINAAILPPAINHKLRKDEPIRILYIGKIRYLDEVKKLIYEIRNDNRFLMKFVGIGSENVKKIADSCGCRNIEFTGMFDSRQTNNYLKDADIIFNLYGDRKASVQTALSNKLYYAVCLNVPILVYKKTYMYEIANSCGIAFPVDDYPAGTVADNLYEWYNKLDFNAIHLKCEEFKEEAIRSHYIFEKELDRILKY